MPLPLIALFVAAFAFGTTEFVVAGVLPQVAEGLGVSIPQAGYLVSGYAVGIAVGGPLMTVATARVSRRTLLIALAAIFTIGQVACALAPGFASMLALRVLVAVAHGVFFGVAMVVAVGLVGPERRGMAVAFVLAGLTVSNVIGVPAGTAIGALFGWRMTFWAMFALGVLATLAMIVLLPRVGAPAAQPSRLGREIGVLGRQQVWTSLIMMLMLMMAQFIPFTYIAPMLREVSGIAPDMIPFVLLLNGLGATVGVFLGGRLAGGRLMQALIGMFLLQSAVMAAMWVLSPLALPMVAVVTVWGLVNFAIGTPIQARILAWTADAPNLAASLIPSGFNLGIAIASSIGAMLLEVGFGYRSLPLLGVLAMLLAAAAGLGSLVAERRSGARPPAAATPAAERRSGARPPAAATPAGL